MGGIDGLELPAGGHVEAASGRQVFLEPGDGDGRPVLDLRGKCLQALVQARFFVVGELDALHERPRRLGQRVFVAGQGCKGGELRGPLCARHLRMAG